VLLLTRDKENFTFSAQKTEKKLDELQLRMGDLMQTNNKLMVQKDNEFKESQKWINELKIVRGTNDELKSLLKDKESHWVGMAKDTLRINEDGIKKLEELKRSEEDLMRTKRALEDDMLYLRKRNGELEQMEIERETDLKVKISEVQVGFGEKNVSYGKGE
jgi:hypothetical protein